MIVVTIVAGACYKKVREFSNKIYDNSISFPSAIELPRTMGSRLRSGLENDDRQNPTSLSYRNPMINRWDHRNLLKRSKSCTCSKGSKCPVTTVQKKLRNGVWH